VIALWDVMSAVERIAMVVVFSAAMGFCVLAAAALVSDLRATGGDR
jgi:hypothetical protein